MKYISTRNKKAAVSGAEAIVKGISSDGGLFVPESLPQISVSDLNSMSEMSYEERALFVISQFLPEIERAELEESINFAYAKFDGDPAPLVKLDESLYFLELFHGPTFAFKDIALTLLPKLMVSCKKITNSKEHTLVLVATSGDTGKAALEGFKDVEGTSIAVIYPESGVSNLQKLQMITTTGDNVHVSGIKGNFDDAQTAAKNVFASAEVAEELFKNNVKLSSANSINWGRLVPQIVYYFSAYCDMVSGGQIKMGEGINFCVPTGNFGNILAGWYAKQMGLPIAKLICASNSNNVLTDFFNGGKYDAKREFFKTSSPSMDILISSNLERLIFEMSGRDDVLTAQRMTALKEDGNYAVSQAELENLKTEFWADFCGEEEVNDCIASFFDETGYIMDPHTAVALNVYDNYVAETGDSRPTVIVSTASPYKFAESVLKALEIEPAKTEYKNLALLEEETAMEIPETLLNLPKMEKIHTGVIKSTAVKDWVLKLGEGINSGKAKA